MSLQELTETLTPTPKLPIPIHFNSQTTNTLPPPNLTSSDTGNFQSLGAITIEGGATLEITNFQFNDGVVTVHTKFSDPSSSAIKVGPLRVSMRTEVFGYGPEPAYAPITLSPKQTKSFDLNYYPEQDPPYRWVYTNFSGEGTELASFSE